MREPEEGRRRNGEARAIADRRLVLPDADDDDEMRRERADREIKSLQAKRRQADQHAENGADDRRGGQRHRDRRVNVRDQRRHREGAGSDEAGMAERDLAGRSHQQVERQRADDRDEDLVGDAGPEIGQRKRQQQARRAVPRPPRSARSRSRATGYRCENRCAASREDRVRSYALKLFARAEDAPRPDPQRDQQAPGTAQRARPAARYRARRELPPRRR